MFIMGLFSWWYSAGWLLCMIRVRDNLLSLYDYFSLDLLLRTLFAPFRQISAGGVQGPLGVQIRAMLDKLISRVIGAVVRGVVIIVGSVTLLVAVCIGLLRILLWPLIPALPMLMVLFAMTGWLPWTI